jgi:hypothetical protein
MTLRTRKIRLLTLRTKKTRLLTLCIRKTRHLTPCILFKEKEEGLYTQEFARVVGFPKANLSHAYLMGVEPSKLIAELKRSSTRWLI